MWVRVPHPAQNGIGVTGKRKALLMLRLRKYTASLKMVTLKAGLLTGGSARGGIAIW